MALKDYHVHTTFSDGADTPEAMVLAAMERGMEELGFSDHAHTPFDESYCIRRGGEAAYRAEIARLREKYRGQIRILCGVEQDYCAPVPAEGYDYVIGSVHYLNVGGDYLAVDDTPEVLRAGIDRHFGGDPYAAAEEYYKLVADVVRKTGADIIGHFDLFAKYNEKAPFFDERHPRYVSAWKRAADALLKTGKPFEINMGAIARGVRGVAYPSPEIRDYLRGRGVKFLLSSDAHCKENLCFRFDEMERELR